MHQGDSSFRVAKSCWFLGTEVTRIILSQSAYIDNFTDTKQTEKNCRNFLRRPMYVGLSNLSGVGASDNRDASESGAKKVTLGASLKFSVITTYIFCQ
jgi:hypothetical protein